MALETKPFNAADYLHTAEDVMLFLEDAFADGDPAEITHALGIVARSRGIGEIADKVGVSRQALYKALTSDGNPSFATVLGVLKAIGFRLVPAEIPAAA